MPKVMGRREIAEDIKLKVVRYYVKKGRGVNLELGLCKRGKLRADVVALAFNGYIVIVEVKSSVADFVNDSKCSGYLEFCNQFYFAFHESVWEKLKDRVDFPPEVGVMTCHPERLKMKIVKKSKRRDVDQDIVHSIALRCAYRGAQYRSLQDLRNGGRFK